MRFEGSEILAVEGAVEIGSLDPQLRLFLVARAVGRLLMVSFIGFWLVVISILFDVSIVIFFIVVLDAGGLIRGWILNVKQGIPIAWSR